MKEFTQTALAPVGNCWQTAVACLLEVEPARLPDQTIHDYRLVDGQWVGRSYSSVLQEYLRKHHGLAYVEMHMPTEALAMVSVRDPGWHIMTGETVRTPINKCRHAVVGRYGQVVWDPHPSRAGLSGEDIRYALLAPWPKAWDGPWREGISCVCPECWAGEDTA